MKKGLILSLFVVFIMVTSLAPLNATTSSQVETQNISIADFLARQTEINSNTQSLHSTPLQDTLNSDQLFVSKTGEVLNAWINEGKYHEGINFVNDQPSVMMMVVGTDATLGGEINPLGSFTFESAGVTWVHTAVSESTLGNLIENPNVLRIEADKKYNQDVFEKLNPTKFETTSDSLPTFNEPFYANDILGATYVNDTFGYNGTGTVVNVMDSGIDFGHSALKGALALTSNNASASFGFGFQTVLSQIYSQNFYNQEGETSKANEMAPLHSDANGYIDPSGLSNAHIWLTGYGIMGTFSSTGIPWMPSIPLPDQFYVGSLPGNFTGYAFGMAFVFNGPNLVLTPFLQADANDDGDYDTLYIDYETAEHYSRYYVNSLNAYFQGTTASTSAIYNTAPKDFTLFPAHTNDNNQYLSADYRDFDSNDPDGFADISLGALSNTFDDLNFTGRLGNADPIIRGIDASGIGFGYFADIDTHGTAVAGELAALPLNYQIDGNQVEIGGVAPGTDIIGTQFFSDTQYIYSNLWVTGYEPNNDLEWSFVNDHVANITTNSWGTPAFEYGEVAYSYDLKSLFLDLLSIPNYVTPNHPGILVVFSAGNAGPGYGTISSSPVGGTFIMVGATTALGWMEEEYLGLFGEDWSNNSQGFDEIAGFSSSGPTVTNYPKVDVVSIGAFDISISPVSTLGNNNLSLTLFSGTSEAAPLTTGVLSLMYNAWNDINANKLMPDTAKTILKSTSKDLGFDAYLQGSGRVDAKAAVHAIVDGVLPSGEQLLIAASEDSLNNYGTKVANAFTYHFGTGNTSIAGYTGLQYPTATRNINDTALYGGSVLAGGSTSLGLNVSGDTIATTEAFTFETINSQVTQNYTQSTAYKYYKLYDLIDENLVMSGDYFKIITSYTEDTQIGYPWMFLIKVNDTDSDGIVDRDERQLYNLDLGASVTDSLFLSSRLIDENTYVMIWDEAFATRNQQGAPALKYKFAFQSYARVASTDVSVSGTTSPLDVTISPAANAMPGQYQGYVRVNGTTGGTVLVPYTYTVPLEVEDYDVAAGWSEITGNRNEPLENGVYGAVDRGWRFNTGDWRYYEMKISGATSTANTLGLEIEWTYEDTMIDVYVLDNDGRVIAKTDIIYNGAGSFASTANNPATMQRLLLDISDYRTGNTQTGGNFSNGYDTFTVVLHAVRSDRNAIPFDPISVRGAWVSETIDQFNIPQANVITTGSDTYNGYPVTTDTIGVEWTQVSTNPIPDFTNVGQEVSINVFQGITIQEDRTIPPEELVSYEEAGGMNPEWTQTVFLEKGMRLSAFLNWESDSDFDFVLIPEGYPIGFTYDIFQGQLATAGKPESGTAVVPASGNYILVVEWFSGNAANSQPFSLTFTAKQSVFQDSTNTGILQTSMNAKDIPNSRYTLVTETGGWNFVNDYETEFYYDNAGPRADYNPEIEEDATGEILIGTILDAVEYDYTFSLGTQTLSSGTNINGPTDLVIDASLVPNVLEPVTFTLTGSDALGKTTSQDVVITRLDESGPEFVISPEAEFDVLVNTEVLLEYELEDVTDGTYLVQVNGEEVLEGTWTSGKLFSIPLTFSETDSFIVRIDFFDTSGNSEFDGLKINVVDSLPDEGSSDGGFLPVSYMIFVGLIAIPVLRRKLKTIN